MPAVPFETLPPDARVWVFAAAEPVDPPSAQRLLTAVDAYLEEWRAHGEPLVCGRDWRDGRFLAVGVDQSTAGASGCSIDALFRVLQHMRQTVGVSMLGGGRVFYRDAAGAVQSVEREAFAQLLSSGAVRDETPVFDTTVTSAGSYRKSFERPLGESWHRQLVSR